MFMIKSNILNKVTRIVQIFVSALLVSLIFISISDSNIGSNFSNLILLILLQLILSIVNVRLANALLEFLLVFLLALGFLPYIGVFFLIIGFLISILDLILFVSSSNKSIGYINFTRFDSKFNKKYSTNHKTKERKTSPKLKPKKEDIKDAKFREK